MHVCDLNVVNIVFIWSMSMSFEQVLIISAIQKMRIIISREKNYDKIYKSNRWCYYSQLQQ